MEKKESEIEIYKKALGFYADEENYEYDYSLDEGGGSNVSLDSGFKAREALGVTSLQSLEIEYKKAIKRIDQLLAELKKEGETLASCLE